MTITLKFPYATYAQGATVTLDNATEAALVDQQRASYTVNSGTSFQPLTPAEQQTLRTSGSVVSNSAQAVVVSSGAQTASVLIKTGPSLVWGILQTSGSGKPTIRDGTTVGGALVAGWGDGGASGLTLTANVPYSTAKFPVNFANGVYLEINGTATCVVYYQ